MAIVVCGGAGYVGSHTVRALYEKGIEVIVVDNLQTGHRAAVPKDVKFYEADLRDKKALDEIFSKENVEGVIHFAANSLVGESAQFPLKYYDNNVYGTQVLLQSMLDNDINYIVFSSSAAVYGDPEKIPMEEDDRKHPESCYGQTKLAMEEMMYWVSKASNLRYVALRYFNACGDHESGEIGEDHNPETHLIPLVLQVANKKREDIKIFGTDYPTEDGTCIRDYVHVNDLARAHILAMEYLQNGGESQAFNVGTGKGYSVREIIEHSRKVTQEPIKAIDSDRREGDPSIEVASVKKIKDILGWQAQYTDLDEILRTAWNWHKNNPDGYGDK